ncbi:hypothetical protein GE061_002157 [Apolygus lucorum]|uniref:LRRCT domain-containing protein n=1 Tax=Apolygus lucorum TaxID=248454 RepID=A0A8S9X494_APOLU|nr:hypothetical protein GE061_002157 [Apolygus lucorum]
MEAEHALCFPLPFVTLASYAVTEDDNATTLVFNTPCPFNTLCRCVSNQSTHGIPIYKSLQVFNQVHCNDVPFTKLPGIPGSNVTELSIVGSGVEVVGDGSLAELNLRTLNLANNRLLLIEPHAFEHSKNTLEALDISYNNLQAIPEYAINKLAHLKLLSVERNEISTLMSVVWGNLTSTLEFLFLSGNHLFSLPLTPGYTLMQFRKLIALKIDGNYLKTLAANSVPFSLVTLDASKNHLDEFPGGILPNLNELKKLYLSDNSIETLPTLNKSKIKDLVVLDISNNLIKQLNDVLGRGFKISELVLSYNKISAVSPKAFSGIACQKLNLSFNKLQSMHERAFYGLTYNLEELDLSSNIFTKLPKSLPSLKRLKRVSLKNNNLFTISDSAFKNSSGSLVNLDLSHNNFQNFPKHTMYNLRRLEKLNFGYNHIIDTGFGFSRWGQTLSFLSLESNQLFELPSNAFKHAHHLTKLKLGYNQFSKISDKAFANLDNLIALDLGFSLKNMSFPENALTPLKRLKELHLDNNNIKELPIKGFASCRQLNHINLQFNKIETLPPNLFRPSTHKELEEVRLAFNKLTVIESLTFGNMQKLKLVDVSFNTLHTLQPESFKNIQARIVILLSHNLLVNIHNRTFINLPNLIELDLHNNELKEINWHMFHNVSNAMHPMTLNLSRNRLDNSWYDLRQNPSWSVVLPEVYVSSIDLSHNEYKDVPFITLNTLNGTLKIVNLGYNHIKTLHDKAFFHLGKVEIVNLEHNIISELNETSFKGLKNVQVVDLSHNHISRIFTEQFGHLDKLRVLDLSYNHISTLPGDAFKRTKIEKLILRGNAFVNVPVQSLLSIGHTLGVLDLSYNRIENMDADQFTTSPLLTDLNLNNLTTWTDAGWINSRHLTELDISSNPIKILTRENFDGLNSLLSLNLQHLNKLERFDADSLVSCSQIVSLKVQTWPNIEKYRFRLPAVLATLKYLQRLSVHIVEKKLTDQLSEAFSKKLRVLEITGSSLQEIGADALKGLDPSKELLLKISGTNVTTLPSNFFSKLSAEALTIDLRGNSLSDVPPLSFYINDESAMRKSGTHKYRGGIWVQGNPISCGCQAFWLGRWMRRYFKEVLSGDTKIYSYGREVLEHMHQAECIEKTGIRSKILTYEMLDCFTGGGAHMVPGSVFLASAVLLALTRHLF